jgi:integrase
MPAHTTSLFKNGTRWWLRLPGGHRTSTGTTDDRLARRVADMVDDFAADRRMSRWLTRVAEGVTTLGSLYENHSRGNLERLEAALDAAAINDAALEPLVGKWIAERIRPATDLREKTKREYERQIRYFLPAGVTFRASAFNEDVLAGLIGELVDDQGEPLSGSTKRRYIAPLRLFYRYARKRVTIPSNPFDDADWLPANNPPRVKYWAHTQVLAVLAEMDGAARAAMTLMFGSGIELGALNAMEKRHVLESLPDGRGLIIAPGSKTDARRDRTIYVDAWAWETVRAYAAGRPKGKLFDFQSCGGNLRDAFYAAQVAAGATEAPPRSEANGVLLWGRVEPHTIHDARHSYCYARLLGDDGEPRQSTKFCSHQLGHTTEQMVMQIYGKCNMDERIRRLEITEARNEGHKETT